MAIAFAGVGFSFILAALSAQALPAQRPNPLLADRVAHRADVTQTVFLPIVSAPMPTVTVTAGCVTGPKGSGAHYNKLHGVIYNPTSRAISDVQVSITIYDVTGTVMEVVSPTVQPGTVLPNSMGLFEANFGARGIDQQNCSPYGRIEAQVTSWQVADKTNVRPLTVVGAQCYGCQFGVQQFLYVRVRNDQPVSLTQSSVTVVGDRVYTKVLTQVIAPSETVTATFITAYVYDFSYDRIIAQGQVHP